MLPTTLTDTFLQLVRLGVGVETDGQLGDCTHIDWIALEALAARQGLSAIVLDGLDKVPPSSFDMPRMMKKQWIGRMYQTQNRNTIQNKAASEMASLFNLNGIRTYVLKGIVIAECYPKPELRGSADLDCFLMPCEDVFDAWDKGNRLMKANGYVVKTGFYKNSTFSLPALMVENHRYLTPFRGNKRLASLERLLQALLRDDCGDNKLEGTWLLRPPIMVTALFLIEHSYSHFLHEGLTWKHVLDWMMFSKKHYADIDWNALSEYVDQFGFRQFFDSYERLGRYLIGDLLKGDLSDKDYMMLADVWAPLDIHETYHGLKGKLAIAGNTWRARWKYRNFAEISMIHALWIQVEGVLFNKHPQLD